MSKVMRSVLEKYPDKTKKNRKSHIVIKTKEVPNPEIVANVRTIPGIITSRGCCYAGCKGVVMGPIKDMLHLVHGPIGCSYYTWGTRRSKVRTVEGVQNFSEYCFSTDLQDGDIVFGGTKKLEAAIEEAVEIFHPKVIGIYSTCPVGLIGDDIGAVASAARKKFGIDVLAFSCEGYKGVSQSAGHHIANNIVFTDIIGKGMKTPKKYPINILGEYNIGGDAWEIERVLEKIGYDVIATLSGDADIESIQNAHIAEVNIVQCHRSINYIAEMLETKYGTPWIKGNFIGVEATIETLRNLAKVFGDEALIKRTEDVIADELAAIEGQLSYYRERLEGKTAILYVGGSRSDHYQRVLQDLGIKSIVAGFEFAHRDDFEGREVIPEIKVDADSKNIPEITVTKDDEKYRVVIPADRYEQLLKAGVPLAYYGGLMKTSKEGTIIIDDLNHHESDELIKLLKPDFFLSGIKEKYVTQKAGAVSKQLHSYDYSGPYAGFRGALVLANSLNAGVYTPAWKYVTPPWKKQSVIGGEE